LKVFSDGLRDGVTQAVLILGFHKVYVTMFRVFSFSIFLLFFFAFFGLAGAYHTADHFCEMCVPENCGAGDPYQETYLACVDSSCGAQCEAWVVTRFGSDGSCDARCDAMWNTCMMASEDAGGLIDEYCTEAASECFASCSSSTDDAYSSGVEGYSGEDLDDQSDLGYDR